MAETGTSRNIGLDVPPPQGTCEDLRCPFHGALRVRGQSFEGVVVSDRMAGTLVVEREYLRLIPKYERYEKRTKRFMVHNPPCLGIGVGDSVTIVECRPLSKTVTFVAVARHPEVSS